MNVSLKVLSDLEYMRLIFSIKFSLKKYLADFLLQKHRNFKGYHCGSPILIEDSLKYQQSTVNKCKEFILNRFFNFINILGLVSENN